MQILQSSRWISTDMCFLEMQACQFADDDHHCHRYCHCYRNHDHNNNHNHNHNRSVIMIMIIVMVMVMVVIMIIVKAIAYLAVLHVTTMMGSTIVMAIMAITTSIAIAIIAIIIIIVIMMMISGVLGDEGCINTVVSGDTMKECATESVVARAAKFAVSGDTADKGVEDSLFSGVYVDEGIVNSAEHFGTQIRWWGILGSRSAGHRRAWRMRIGGSRMDKESARDRLMSISAHPCPPFYRRLLKIRPLLSAI